MRHPALIPLSREHHYALVFGRSLKRGDHADPAWVRRWISKARRFYDLDLRAHFAAEEEVLFPASRAFNLGPLVDELVAEHRALERLIDEGRLCELADLLEAHIRKEERQLFDVLDTRLGPENDLQAAIEARIGKAECPRDPSLIQESL